MANAQKNLDVCLTDDKVISLVLLLERLRENSVGPYTHNLSESVGMIAAIDKLTIALHRVGYVTGGVLSFAVARSVANENFPLL